MKKQNKKVELTLKELKKLYKEAKKIAGKDDRMIYTTPQQIFDFGYFSALQDVLAVMPKKYKTYPNDSVEDWEDKSKCLDYYNNAIDTITVEIKKLKNK